MGLSLEGKSIPFCYYKAHIFFTILFNRATLLDIVPFTEPTQLNTKCSVDLPTMHSHPFNTMSPCICNAICHCRLSCHMHNECYMDNTIHTTYRCHGQSHHLHMTSIHYFIHVNISTFTFNMSFYVQAMTNTQASHLMAIAHTNSSHVDTLEYSH